MGAARRETDAELAALVRAAQAGSRAAFARLVRRFEAPLFHLLLLRCGSREDAEELAQETFLLAWRKLDRFDARRRFAPWLFTLGRRAAATRARSAPAPPAAGARTLERAQPDADPFASLGAREERARLWALAARELDRVQLQALWLRYAEDLAPAEIAQVLGRSPVAVRVLLHRARARLARGLERLGQADGGARRSRAGMHLPAAASSDARLRAQARAGGAQG